MAVLSHKKIIDLFFESYSLHDKEGIKKVMSEDVTWSFLGQHKMAGERKGIDDVISFFDNMNAIMTNSNPEIEKLIVASNPKYLIECQHIKTDRTDGVNIDYLVAVLWKFENGKIISGQHLFADPKAVDNYFNAVPMKTIHLFGNNPVIVEQIFKAPIEVVWKAITDAKQMKKWYFETMNSFEPIVGFETEFNVPVGDKNYLHKWKITEVITNRRITYTWRFGGYTGEWTVTFDLIPEKNSFTKLKITNIGIESFPLNNPDFSRESCQEGWEFFINKRLVDFLKN